MSSATASSLSVIIPVYNEEAIIINSIQQNLDVLENAGIEYEIIIVDDGSNDSSWDLLMRFFGENTKITTIHLAINSGFGHAVKTGIENAVNTFLMCVPVDSPLTPDVFTSIMASAPLADVIVSHRIKRLGYTMRMRMNSYVYHFLIENVFGIHFLDFNWIHLYHRKIFDEGGININSKGIFMLAEVLIRADNKGYTFIEVPVAQHERITGIASASKISVLLKTIKEMLAFWLEYDKKGN